MPTKILVVAGARNGRSRKNFDVTSAQPMVELTSPTTSTASGCSCCKIGSKRFMISAVCCACVPEPTSSSRSGFGIFRSSKNTFDSLAS